MTDMTRKDNNRHSSTNICGNDTHTLTERMLVLERRLFGHSCLFVEWQCAAAVLLQVCCVAFAEVNMKTKQGEREWEVMPAFNHDKWKTVNHRFPNPQTPGFTHDSAIHCQHKPRHSYDTQYGSIKSAHARGGGAQGHRDHSDSKLVGGKRKQSSQCAVNSQIHTHYNTKQTNLVQAVDMFTVCMSLGAERWAQWGVRHA